MPGTSNPVPEYIQSNWQMKSQEIARNSVNCPCRGGRKLFVFNIYEKFLSYLSLWLLAVLSLHLEPALSKTRYYTTSDAQGAKICTYPPTRKKPPSAATQDSYLEIYYAQDCQKLANYNLPRRQKLRGSLESSFKSFESSQH